MLPSIDDVAPHADALLGDHAHVTFHVEQRFAQYASIRITGVDGLRGFILQGAASAASRLKALADAGAQVIEQTQDPQGTVTGRLVAPITFSSAHRIRPMKGSELRLGRVLSSFELYMLAATVGAAVAVAVLLLLPRFPGRKTLAILLLVLVVLLSGLAFVFTGNFAIPLDGVSLALDGSVTIEANVRHAGSQLTLSEVRISDTGSVKLRAEALVPVPDFALSMVQGSLVAILQNAMNGVSVTLPV